MTRRMFGGTVAMTLGLLGRRQICKAIKLDSSSQDSLIRLTEPQVNLISGEVSGLVHSLK